MGRVVFLMAGDFRQTLPVIPKPTKADEIKACIKCSYLWPSVTKMKLETNMRVLLSGDVSAGEFTKKQLDIGDGKLQQSTEDGLLSVDFGTNCSMLEELEEQVFPNVAQNHTNLKWLGERAILTPKMYQLTRLFKV